MIVSLNFEEEELHEVRDIYRSINHHADSSDFNDAY